MRKVVHPHRGIHERDACGSRRAATTRTSACSSAGSIRSPAHSAIAGSRLNGSCGAQRTVEVSGPELSRTSVSTSPAAAASAASWPADSGSGLPAAVMNASASSNCAPPCCQDSGPGRRAQPGHSARNLAEHPRTLRQSRRHRASAGSRRPGPVALSPPRLSQAAPRTGPAVRDRHRHRRLQQQRRLGTRQQARCERRDRRFRVCPIHDQVAPGRIERRPRELRGRPHRTDIDSHHADAHAH